jgi:Winged helix DNA-binding domain
MPCNILRRRLANQHLIGHALSDPRQVVAHLGAVQSQDFPAALWALSLRVTNASITSLQRAFNGGEFLRTHVLRPTWHFVAPEDIRWMLALTGPRIRRGMAARERDLGMDASLVWRSNDAIAHALEGGRSLTRGEIGVALTQAGVDWHDDGSLLAHLASCAELASIVCSGPSRGSQQTYALLDERVPPARSLSREESVAELVCRYFTSHGPATVHDFAWWSGLTVGDARQGLAAFGDRFTSQKLGDLTYWFDPESPTVGQKSDEVMLLPNFDEFTVAYRARELFYPREIAYRPGPRYDAPFGNVIVVDGVVQGIWKRTLRKGSVSIEPEWFNPPSPHATASFDCAVARYRGFMDPRVGTA